MLSIYLLKHFLHNFFFGTTFTPQSLQKHFIPMWMLTFESLSEKKKKKEMEITSFQKILDESLLALLSFFGVKSFYFRLFRLKSAMQNAASNFDSIIEK